MMNPRVLWLHSRKARDRRLAGGKASNLATLVSLGYPVPNGFVVPVGAPGKLSGPWERDLQRASSRLRPPLAVRSSLVGEDDIHQSFAGQLETVLNVDTGPGLKAAIDRVRSSVHRPGLETYVRQSAVDVPMDLAILVQEMVPGVAAGVAFSADPITGRSSVVIEAVPHLGDELAMGRAEPDRFVIDPRGVLSEETRQSLDTKALPETIIFDLAAMVRGIAAHFGVPQDVEWAWDGANLFVLQSRPVTSLVGKSVYSRKLVGDMTPGPISHLVWSTNTLGMVDGVFREVFTHLLGENDYDFKRILRRIRSRAYVDTTFVGQLLAEVGLPRNLFEAIAREERVPRRLKLNRKLLSRTPAILYMIWRYGHLEREMENVLGSHDRALGAFRTKEWVENSPADLLEGARTLLALHRSLQRCIMFGSMNLAIRTRFLKRYVARHAPGVDPSDLLLGLRGLKSLEPNRELQAIAERAGAMDRALVELLLSGDHRSIRETLSENDQGRRILAEVEKFLDRFGFLSANGTNFGEPTWEEEPGPLWRALGRMIRDGPPPASDPGTVREAARETVLSQLGALQRRRFLRRLASASHYLELRERISLLMTEDTYQLRRLFLAMGRSLVEADRVQDPDDVFFLSFSELEEAVTKGEGGPGLRDLVRARREEISADRDVDLPETILGEDLPPPELERDVGPLLTGIGVSAGVVEGTARLVRDLEDAPGHLSKDDVLVVPFSDVGWTPLFATVGGVVAECGGQLSHTAIVAREYGLPAVVGVRRAMKQIEEGQRITVDGGRGRVILAETGIQRQPMPET